VWPIYQVNNLLLEFSYSATWRVLQRLTQLLGEHLFLSRCPFKLLHQTGSIKYCMGAKVEL
jgi:hypothetical protein